MTHKTVLIKINQIHNGVFTNYHAKLASFLFVFEQYNIQLFNKKI